VPHQPDLPTECPACHSPRVARILYGLPHFTAQRKSDLDQGRVVLGGCCVFGDDPAWHCLACQHRWGSLAWPDPLPENLAESEKPEGGSSGR
jgi:hypothetical protein